MRRSILIACTLALLTSACAGPRAKLEVGSKEIPVNIVLGSQRQDVPPPPPSSGTGGGFPGFIQPPIPIPEPGAPPPAGPRPSACPIGNPLDAAELVARAEAPLPPVAETYTYRNQGRITVGELETEYPETMTRRVANVKMLTSRNYEFDVAATVAGTTTTTRYRVLNEGVTPDRGVYIVQIVTARATGNEAFTPDRPILLMPFPSPEYGTNLEDEIDRYRGQQYRSVGTDPLTQTTMTLEATIDGKQRVDACGKWIDTFGVTVTDGRIVSPTKQITFTGTYAIATQYGALVVEDDLETSGTDGLKQLHSKNRSRITTLPREP